MVEVVRDDAVLLVELLNTSPVFDGRVTDSLQSLDDGVRWLRRRGLPASPSRVTAARRARDAIGAVVRGEALAASLGPFLTGVVRRPVITVEGGIDWELRTGRADAFAARCVLAWGRVERDLPGRLRACENPECRQFLLDRSRANTRRWCSMAACGNRLKARRHYQRASKQG